MVHNLQVVLSLRRLTGHTFLCIVVLLYAVSRNLDGFNFGRIFNDLKSLYEITLASAPVSILNSIFVSFVSKFTFHLSEIVSIFIPPTNILFSVSFLFIFFFIFFFFFFFLLKSTSDCDLFSMSDTAVI